MAAHNVFRPLALGLVTLVLRWPLWWLLALTRPFIRWRSLFVVYPGRVDDIRAYSPDSMMWLRKSWLYWGKPQFAGVQIRPAGQGGETFWGIVVYVSSTVDEMQRDRDLVAAIMRRLHSLARLLGIQVIACAGQMPSIMFKHGFKLERPFIDGRLGSAYSVVTTVHNVYARHKLDKHGLLCVVGIGFLGRSVIDSLQDSGYRVQGIDIVKTTDGVAIGEDALKLLAGADVVVVLTPRGQDFIPYMHYLKSGAIVIDDTHPHLRIRSSDHPIYKVALEWPGFAFKPRLPGYRKHWIPGCMVEAIVTSQGARSQLNDRDFSLAAQQFGFRALIEEGMRK